MGQVSSTAGGDSILKPVVMISPSLRLVSMQILSSNKINFKVDNDQIIMSNYLNPLKFTQNDNINEFPFLVNVEANDVLKFKFKVVNVGEPADHAGYLDVFNNVKASIFDKFSNLVTEFSIYDDIQIVNYDKTTVDPKNLQITTKNTNSSDFSLKFDLNKLLTEKYSGKLTIVVNVDNSEFELLRASVFVNENLTLDTSGRTERNFPQVPTVSPEIQSSLNSSFLLEDGKSFNNELNLFETNISLLQPLVKSIIKKSESLNESLRNIAIIRSSLANSLLELISFFNLKENPLNNPILIDILKEISAIQTEKSRNEIDSSNNCTKFLITPLLNFYNSDIKSIKLEKHLYQEDSRTFYNNDSNDFDQFKAFQLKRLKYYNYLNEFKKGKEVRLLVNKLSEFYKHEAKSTLSDILQNSTKFYDDYQEYKLNQMLLQNLIENTKSFEELNAVLERVENSSKGTSHTDQYKNQKIPTPIGKEYIIRKSDVLYSLDINTRKWDKKYIVLKDNILREFKVQYKDSNVPSKFLKLDDSLITDQLNLTDCKVVKFKTKNKGKFCFQITHREKDINKIYQVYNDKEQESWSTALISSTKLNTFQNQHSPNSLKSPYQSHVISIPDLMTTPSQDSITILSGNSSALEILSNIDFSNRTCCDCGSRSNVGWLSLRSLVVICKNCSDVHRKLNLGSVIPLSENEPALQIKEVRELLFHVSNKISDSYWLGSISSQFQTDPNWSLQERSDFINDKYRNKKFRVKDPKTDPNGLLITAIKTKNVSLVLKSICLGADLSTKVIQKSSNDRNLIKVDELKLFEYSLRHPILNDDNIPVFHIAQLLVFNGVDVGNKVKNISPLNDIQLQFWKEKITERLKNNTKVLSESSTTDNNKNKLIAIDSGPSKSISNYNEVNEPNEKKVRKRLSFFRKKSEIK